MASPESRPPTTRRTSALAGQVSLDADELFGDVTTESSVDQAPDSTAVTAVGSDHTEVVMPVEVPPSRRSDVPPRSDARVRHGRRVVRVVRRIQPWSVFKIALLSSVVLYAVSVISSAILWSLATSTGQVHHIEKFMRDIGFNGWTFNGAVLFQAVLLAGAIGVIVTSILITLWAAVVNLVSELTGGIRVIVIEEGPEFDED